jgi:hypothetical protein
MSLLNIRSVEEIMQDIPNYTDLSPVVQISEVMVA